MSLKVSQNLLENTCIGVSILINFHACSFIKKGTLEEEVSFHLVSKLPLRRSKFSVKGNSQFVQKVTFGSLMDFKENFY